MKEEKQLRNINVPSNADKEIRSSIEITKNSKGYNWAIKRYYKDDEKVEEVLKEIETTDRELRNKYGDGNDS